jgi:hypothetical protein
MSSVGACDPTSAAASFILPLRTALGEVRPAGGELSGAAIGAAS